MDKPDITLVFPSSPFLIDPKVFPSLGILYLAGYLKDHGLQAQCLDMAMHAPDMAKADIVGISITTPQRMEAYKLAEYYKKKGKTVIAGGPHATHMPGECKEHGFDYVLGNEAERSLYHFLKTDERLRPVSEFNASLLPADAIPFPDRDALPIHDYKYELNEKPATVMMTSRSCPYNCSFCAKMNNNFRMQSAQRTVDEILHINKKYGFEAFMIFDDVFIINKKRLAAIADGVKGRGFVFRCFGRTNLINEDTCRLIKKLGVVEVGLGVESGADKILDKNIKKTSRKMNTQAVKLLHKHGIRAKAFLIVGLPGETPETIEKTSSWIQEAKPDDVDISIFQPLPGSVIFNDPESWGIKFKYDGKPQWYKGQPGKYDSTVNTGRLSAQRIIAYRALLEATYKDQSLLR